MEEDEEALKKELKDAFMFYDKVFLFYYKLGTNIL